MDSDLFISPMRAFSVVVGLWPRQRHLLIPLTRAYSTQRIHLAGERNDDNFNTRPVQGAGVDSDLLMKA